MVIGEMEGRRCRVGHEKYETALFGINVSAGEKEMVKYLTLLKRVI